MGIIADLSEYQGIVDFSKLAKVVDAVILRVQAGYTHPDAKYKEYVAGCKAYNIPFGTYAYFKGISVPDAIAEAKNAYILMDPASHFFVVDIEAQTTKNVADLVPAGQAYVDYMKNQKVDKVGVYSYDAFYKQYGLSAIKADFHWMAAYGKNDGQPHTAPSTPAELWQFTSVGKLDGITGNVDESQLLNKPLSYFFGESEDMLENVVIINGANDYPAAELLAVNLKCPIYSAAAVPVDVKFAKNVYLCGATIPNLQAEKVVNLTGNDRYSTAAAIAKFLGK